MSKNSDKLITQIHAMELESQLKMAIKPFITGTQQIRLGQEVATQAVFKFPHEFFPAIATLKEAQALTFQAAVQILQDMLGLAVGEDVGVEAALIHAIRGGMSVGIAIGQRMGEQAGADAWLKRIEREVEEKREE